MKVYIQELDPMEIKNKGSELIVKTPKGEHLGKLVVTKTQIVWCNGKTHTKNGKGFKWEQFINLMTVLAQILMKLALFMQ